jgi:hypothetical protein
MSKTPPNVRSDLTTHIMDKVVQAANDVADLVDIDEEPEGVMSLYSSAILALLALALARFQAIKFATTPEHMQAVDNILGVVRARYKEILKRDLAPLMKAKSKRSADRK